MKRPSAPNAVPVSRAKGGGKTRRFGDLVRESGRPEPITLWLGPKGDRAFSRAIHDNRVLTVQMEPGKRDFGRIGFHQVPGAMYLVFPRTLPKDPASRIVGINLQLLEDEESKAATRKV